MIDITLVGDKAVDAALQDYPKRATKAMVRAMNRSGTSGRAFLVQKIAPDMNLKAGEVRKAIILREATAQRPEVRVGASLKRLPLEKFGARQIGRGVSYNLGRGRQVLAGAFIATLRSGHRGVFVRKIPSTHKSPGAWSKNLPIEEKAGASIGHVFGKYRPAAIVRMREAFETNFAHEMNFAGAKNAGAD